MCVICVSYEWPGHAVTMSHNEVFWKLNASTFIISTIFDIPEKKRAAIDKQPWLSLLGRGLGYKSLPLTLVLCTEVCRAGAETLVQPSTKSRRSVFIKWKFIRILDSLDLTALIPFLLFSSALFRYRRSFITSLSPKSLAPSAALCTRRALVHDARPIRRHDSESLPFMARVGQLT